MRMSKLGSLTTAATDLWRRTAIGQLHRHTLGIDESQHQFAADTVADGNFNEKNTRARF
jgi:hypothetical protein